MQSTKIRKLSVQSTIHIRQTGGLAVLKGNLAPDGSVVKRSAVVDEMLVHEGPARVFECEEDAISSNQGWQDCNQVM